MAFGKKTRSLQRAVLFQVLQVLFLCTVPVLCFAANWQWISPQRVNSMVKEGSGLWLVDVRNETSFSRGHIEGAVHLPAGLLGTKSLPKGKIIVLTDDSLGLRNGREAADVLVKKGHEKVFLLEGGIQAWQGEGLPVAGQQSQGKFASVMPEDLAWAQQNRIPVRIFDLRDKAEREKGPVSQAVTVEGQSLPERLEKANSMVASLDKKELAARLEKPITTILVLPMAVDDRSALQRAFRGSSGDIRLLEGGYAAWAARPDKTANTVGACPVCPGGVSGGKK